MPKTKKMKRKSDKESSSSSSESEREDVKQEKRKVKEPEPCSESSGSSEDSSPSSSSATSSASSSEESDTEKKKKEKDVKKKPEDVIKTKKTSPPKQSRRSSRSPELKKVKESSHEMNLKSKWESPERSRSVGDRRDRRSRSRSRNNRHRSNSRSRQRRYSRGASESPGKDTKRSGGNSADYRNDKYKERHDRDRDRERDHDRDRDRDHERDRDRDRDRGSHRDRRDNPRDRRDDRTYNRDQRDDRNYDRDQRRPRDDRRRSPYNDKRDGRNGRRQRRGSKEDDRSYEWGKKTDDKSKDEKPEKVEKEKPNFGLSGALLEDTNKVNGVIVKYSEPPEARKPKRRWRLYPFKGETALPILHIHRQSCFLVGRDRKVVDLPVDHPSCSKQHAALQYRLVPFEREDGTNGKRVRLYLIDLESANGTFLNGNKIDPKKYYELMEKDVIKFGFSTREYVLLHENSKEDQEDDDVKIKGEEDDLPNGPNP